MTTKTFIGIQLLLIVIIAGCAISKNSTKCLCEIKEPFIFNDHSLSLTPGMELGQRNLHVTIKKVMKTHNSYCVEGYISDEYNDPQQGAGIYVAFYDRKNFNYVKLIAVSRKDGLFNAKITLLTANSLIINFPGYVPNLFFLK